MPEGRPSRTAEWVALVRAADQLIPPERRIVDDPFAEPFLRRAGSNLVLGGGARGPIARVATAIFRLPWVGMAAYVLARHRTLDDLLLDEVRTGATQAVILGAGYDARAVRFPPAKGGPARVFEIDHPTLSALKRSIVADTLGAPPPHVAYVAVDFLREKLTDRLLAEGFDPRARTVFLWEGVTMYLTRDAVLETLGAVRSIAAPGSVIAFDSLLRVKNASQLHGASGLVTRLILQRLREPFLFFLEEGGESASDLLRATGYEPIFDKSSADMQRDYDRLASGRGGRLQDYCRLSAGRVPVA